MTDQSQDIFFPYNHSKNINLGANLVTYDPMLSIRNLSDQESVSTECNKTLKGTTIKTFYHNNAVTLGSERLLYSQQS